MSINVHVKDPSGKNISKLIHAIADYVNINQGINIGIDIDFLQKKKDC